LLLPGREAGRHNVLSTSMALEARQEWVHGSSEQQYRLALKRAAAMERAFAALRENLAAAKPSARGRAEGVLW
jgi:hypothetical protein